MASESSFDIVNKVDRQEVDNAVNQAAKEISQRFDFKNVDAQIKWSGESIDLPALLLVDGESVTSDASKLAKVKVSAEVVGPHKGPKITIMKFKNKTGYRKRQGHRQHETRVKVTAIEA